MIHENHEFPLYYTRERYIIFQIFSKVSSNSGLYGHRLPSNQGSRHGLPTNFYNQWSFVNDLDECFQQRPRPLGPECDEIHIRISFWTLKWQDVCIQNVYRLIMSMIIISKYYLPYSHPIRNHFHHATEIFQIFRHFYFQNSRDSKRKFEFWCELWPS